jgi:hypothetical protein
MNEEEGIVKGEERVRWEDRREEYKQKIEEYSIRYNSNV